MDVKLLGVASVLGVKSPTLTDMFRRGKAVLSAARACDGHRLAGCRVVAYLLRRPPGPTFNGVACSGRWAFVAVDVDVLLAWNETGTAAPRRFLTLGTSPYYVRQVGSLSGFLWVVLFEAACLEQLFCWLWAHLILRR